MYFTHFQDFDPLGKSKTCKNASFDLKTKMCFFFFQLFSTIKVNLVAEIMQSVYLCVIIHVKQLPSLVKSKMAIIVDDVTRLQQRHH